MHELQSKQSAIKVSHATKSLSGANLKGFDEALIVTPKICSASLWRLIPGAARLKAQPARRADKSGVLTTQLNNSKATQVSLAKTKLAGDTFGRMEQARKLAASVLANQPASVAISVLGFDDDDSRQMIELLVEAMLIGSFDLPTFKRKTPETNRLRKLAVFGENRNADINAAAARANANNLTRWLGALPPNKLTAGSYRAFSESMAKQQGWAHKFYGEAALKKLGAGAFLAVAQGNADKDAGILHLRYRPNGIKNPKRIALVGKGIIFDTGGNNLKPFRSMLDMHTDMLGSAVALSSLRALSELQAPFQIDCWLALTENRIGAKAYKSQDLIQAMNGKTIQTIHTDAEGRMALADTLCLAATEKPDAIMDFATLTGACVAALTSRYSGVFSNRSSINQMLSDNGQSSGERVWPFPVSDEFTDMVRSDNADLLQCTIDNDGDHILAACFLREFVPKSIGWVHMDLSAATRKGGLGLSPTEITGFGARYVIELLNNTDKFSDLVKAND